MLPRSQHCKLELISNISLSATADLWQELSNLPLDGTFQMHHTLPLQPMSSRGLTVMRMSMHCQLGLPLLLLLNLLPLSPNLIIGCFESQLVGRGIILKGGRIVHWGRPGGGHVIPFQTTHPWAVPVRVRIGGARCISTPASSHPTLFAPLHMMQTSSLCLFCGTYIQNE